MANIARLGVVLGLNSAEFTKGMESAKKSVVSFAQDAMPMLKNAALVGVAALTGMVYKSLQLSDQIADLAAATELSVSSVLKISDAFQQSGGKYEEAGKSIQKFSETVDNAAKGSFELQKAFSTVGISLSDLSKLSVEQLFYKAVDGISKVSDSATKAGVKMDLFGKSMRNIDVSGFNDQLKEGTSDFDEYAKGIKAAADLADKLEKNLRELVLIFTKELGPTLNRIFDTINVKGGVSEKVFGGLRDIILDAWYNIEKFVITLQKLEVVLNQLPGGSKQFENFGEQLDALDEKARLLKEKVYGSPTVVTLPKITVLSGEGEGTGGRNVKAGKNPEAEQEKKIQAMIRMASLNADEFHREQTHASEMAASREHMNSLTENGRKIQESVNEVLDATSRKIKEISDKREEAVSKESDPRIIAAYDEQIAKIQIMGNEFATLAGEQTAASIEAQKTFSYGWNQAFQQYAEDAENYAKVGKDMFSAVTGAMSNAITQFVESGKFSFKDFAGSVIKDLIRIQLQAQATALFNKGLKLVMGAIGSYSGGATTMGAGSLEGGEGALSFAVDMTRANGGTVSGGSPYMVGERGAELFIPGRSGTVIPNNNLRDVMGGGGVTYNGTVIQNMQAIDTQSGLQFLAKNKMNIYALNQSAGRSMPASR
jgi:lambda family phage tail tape measure protein